MKNKMNSYNYTAPFIESSNDIYVQVTRKHADNMFMAVLYYAIAAISMCAILYLALYNKWFLLLLIFSFAFYTKADYLVKYTQEAREILYQNNGMYNNEEVVISEEKQVTSNHHTVITGANNKTRHILHLDLTQGQLQQIAKAALSTESLTVNFLEGIGLSRQDAELLRVELTQYGILAMDNKGRTKLTRDGVTVFKRMVK